MKKSLGKKLRNTFIAATALALGVGTVYAKETPKVDAKIYTDYQGLRNDSKFIADWNNKGNSFDAEKFAQFQEVISQKYLELNQLENRKLRTNSQDYLDAKEKFSQAYLKLNQLESQEYKLNSKEAQDLQKEFSQAYLNLMHIEYQGLASENFKIKEDESKQEDIVTTELPLQDGDIKLNLPGYPSKKGSEKINVEYGIESITNGGKNLRVSIGTSFLEKLVNVGGYIRGRITESGNLTYTESKSSSSSSVSEPLLKNTRVETMGNITKTRNDYTTKDVTETSQEDNNVIGYSGPEVGAFVKINPPFVDFGKWGKFSLGYSRGLVRIDKNKIMNGSKTTTSGGYSTIKAEFTDPVTGEKTVLADEKIDGTPTTETIPLNSKSNLPQIIDVGEVSVEYSAQIPATNTELGLAYGQSQIYSGENKDFLERALFPGGNNTLWRLFLKTKF